MRVRLIPRRIPRPRRDERGAVTLTVAFLLVPMMLLAAFVLDVGNSYAQARAFSSGADSAALAVVQQKRLALTANPAAYSPGRSSTCSDVRVQDGSASASTALDLATANQPRSVGLTAPDVAASLSCNADGVLEVTVTVTRSVPTTLGRLAGVDAITVRKTATAALGGASEVAGAKPIAVCDLQAQDVIAAGLANPADPAARLIHLEKVWSGEKCNTDAGDSAGAGNWGFLYCGSNGASKLAEYITDGCPAGTIRLVNGTLHMTGTPGNKGSSNPVDTALEAEIGDTMVLPVYTTVSQNGANADYTISGFLTVRLCGYHGKNAYRAACFDSSVGLPADTMQVRYVGFQTAADIARTTCGIGTASCGSVLGTALLR
ncbi:pilus assembly protein TadG-related protein [Oryzobacter sp. R7]|uniref:pilus assembly protein TadG-related protein n=1 Tax=Oryzobacter faecalis TaxID=3388656 RepID=UPI00398CA4DF